jgi:hypothetical protein
MVQNNQKMVFLCCFAAFGQLNRPKTLCKGPQVVGMYIPMSKLENGPTNQIISPILVGEIVQTCCCYIELIIISMSLTLDAYLTEHMEGTSH